MKPGIKATAILIITLALGIALGFVSHGTWMHYRYEHHDRRPGGWSFTERMERILDLDSLNADTVRAVLAQHAERFRELNIQQHEAMQALMDTLITDLKGLVPEDRIETLERIRDRGGFRHSRGRPGDYRR